MIQAALNGDRMRDAHRSIPISGSDLVADGIACVAFGAGAIHMHPRDTNGVEVLDAKTIDAVVRGVRDACGVPVGVTTGEWIEPDFERRIAMIRGWTEVDFASVNMSETGSIEIIQAMLDTGTGIEAGVWTVADAETLGESGLGNQVTRVLVEPGEIQVGDDQAAALALCEAIHRTLDKHGIMVPRLQHADGRVTWVVLEDAIRRGIDTRVGFEDTLYLPTGALAEDNAALIRAASSIRDRLS